MVDNLCVITESVVMFFESQKHHVIVKLISMYRFIKPTKLDHF